MVYCLDVGGQYEKVLKNVSYQQKRTYVEVDEGLIPPPLQRAKRKEQSCSKKKLLGDLGN